MTFGKTPVVMITIPTVALFADQNSQKWRLPHEVKRFEDLPVWNTAIELAVAVYSLTSKPEFAPHHSLKDQIERAAVSVSNNIAEGFERGANKELLMFLYISRISSLFLCETSCVLCDSAVNDRKTLTAESQRTQSWRRGTKLGHYQNSNTR